MAIDYSQMTYNNQWRLKRWSHGARFQIALDLSRRFVSRPRNMLDYGAGDGHFAHILRAANPDAKVVAFDPGRSMASALKAKAAADAGLSVVFRKEEIDGTYDTIFCLEVLEHLQDDEILRALDLWRDHLREEGVVIVSVPIETGLGGLLKTAVRLGIGESHREGHSSRAMCKAVLGFEIDRGQASYIGSHIGFSHSRLRRLLQKSGVTIRQTRYSPMPWTGPINSQCFWVLSFA